VRGDPVRESLGGDGLGIGVVAGAEDRHEELGSGDLAARRVDDRKRVAREVEEELLPGAVLSAQDDVETVSIGPIALGEPGVAEAVGTALTVLRPPQHERDALAAKLPVDSGPVGLGTAQDHRWRGGPTEQPLFERSIVEGIGERPAKTGPPGPLEIVADGRAGQADGDADGPRTQVLNFMESQDFSDLAHGSTGTGHRLFSSMTDSIEESVADATGLTPPPACLSEGGPGPWDWVAIPRRNQVAITRGIRTRCLRVAPPGSDVFLSLPFYNAGYDPDPPAARSKWRRLCPRLP
jgi:hypothetical protein